MMRYVQSLYRLLKAMGANPRAFARAVNMVPHVCSADRFARAYEDAASEATTALPSSSMNPLWEYFQNHREGHGIWKWEHYFDIYHRHFARFVNQKVDVVEIGIYSGGSLQMWRSYFGNQSRIYGVDIEKACKAYENDHTSVFIGDQADRAFWARFKDSVKGVDIVIDDGGHTLEQQQTTLEELLPYLRPGGVYLCEDVHGKSNSFSAFAAGLVSELNNMTSMPGPIPRSGVSTFQSMVCSIHFYPYVVVIEKHRVPPGTLVAPKHGTEWQPFL